MFLARTLLWHYWGGPLPAEVQLRDLLALLLAGLLHGAINTPSAAVARLFGGKIPDCYSRRPLWACWV
ncbi:MAG: hypothetical protein C4304_03080 [candidate division GAL15 bacterium]